MVLTPGALARRQLSRRAVQQVPTAVLESTTGTCLSKLPNDQAVSSLETIVAELDVVSTNHSTSLVLCRREGSSKEQVQIRMAPAGRQR